MLPWTAPETGLFFERLGTADPPVLFLDYDGTLAPFCADPAGAVPDPEMLQQLRPIAQSGSRVVVVSGRRASELARFVESVHPIEIWGSHGLERVGRDGAYEAVPMSTEARRRLLEEEEWWAGRGWRERLESKPYGLVVNARDLPDSAFRRLRHEAQDRWAPLAECGLVVQESEHGIEIRLGGRDKGTAVRTVLAESGPHAVGAYLGDDCTDEEAFRAIRGRGMGALVRTTPRETAAELWLRPPGEVVAFLARWRDSVGAAKGRR